MKLDSTSQSGDVAEGLFAKTSKMLHPAPPQPSTAPLPASLHVPANSLSASQLLYDFGPPEPVEAFPQPKIAAEHIDTALADNVTGALKPQNDDSPRLRSLLIEIEGTPPEKLGLSLAETEKKIAKFREDRKNDRAVWLENPQLETQYIVLLRNMILPAKPKESSNHEAVAVRKAPQPTVRDEIAESLADDEVDEPVPAPLPPVQAIKKPKTETAVAPPAPSFPKIAQLESEDSKLPAPTPKSDILQVSYTAETPSGDWKAQVRIAADLLRTKIESTPDARSFSNEANLRLLELVLGNRQEAVRPFSQVDKPINDCWSNQMLGFSTLLDETGNPDKKHRLATASSRFDEGANELRRLCPMKLQNVQFVKDWVEFGVFLPRKEDCQAGETVGLYLELDNPIVKHSALGYSVRPTIHYEIRDSAAKLVFKSNDESLEQTTPSPKRDYCIFTPVRLPKGLAHGQYLLRVSVTDMNSDNLQHAEEQLSFRVLPSAKSYHDE